MSQPHLQRQLHARHLWAIAVGMVISGQYFGWNYGFAKAHVLGLCIAVAIVTVFYLCFMYSYAELATCIPKAGGPTAYAHKAMGHFMGYMAGLACLIEFIFAPPAIAVAIGYYVNFLWPVIPAAVATVTSFVFCLLLNLIGTKDVAIFELVITVFALIGLALFYLAGYHFLQHHSAYKHPLFLPAHHYTLILSAIPFAIWLYLAIEGAAMSAEEVRNPQREISKGFIAAIITIVICSTLTIYFVASLNKNITAPIDYPISHTLALLYGHNSFIARCVDILGLCGLLASLNGITIGYSRQTYALARRDYLPKFLTQMSKKGVPYAALLIPGILGLLACSSAKFSNSLIILAAFGAVTMYCIALLSLFVLRVRHPELNRPFKVFYPWVPVCGLFLGVICWYSILRYAILPNSMMLLDHRVPLLDVLASIYIIAIFYYFARRLRYPIAT